MKLSGIALFKLKTPADLHEFKHTNPVIYENKNMRNKI